MYYLYFNLKKLGNLFLSIISGIMFLFTLHLNYQNVQEKGLFNTYCNAELFDRKGIWFVSYMFCLSKYAELFDTVFAIMKNPQKPVQFLHWYHHVTVLIFTWYSAKLKTSVGHIFMIMNAFVHTVMYFYYFTTGYKIRVPRLFIKSLTLIQIIQMIVGCVLCLLWTFNYFFGSIQCNCLFPISFIVYSNSMYGSYLYLFVSFFKSKYNKKKKSQ